MQLSFVLRQFQYLKQNVIVILQYKGEIGFNIKNYDLKDFKYIH